MSWVIGVDVGGTFTDAFFLDEEAGRIEVAKVPSTRGNQAEGFLDGIGRHAPDLATVAAIKESSGDTRSFVDLQNLVGDRFTLFCGLDDVVLESVLLGAVGWVSGLSNVFPKESNELFRFAFEGKWEEARALYRWFMPLLHLDARSDLVQCIKLCEQIAGRGSERTRPPRLALEGAERAEVERLMRDALAKRPAAKAA